MNNYLIKWPLKIKILALLNIFLLQESYASYTEIEKNHREGEYDSTYFCEENSEEREIFLCIATSNMTSPDIETGHSEALNYCEVSVVPNISKNSGYEFLYGHFPLYKIDHFKFPDFNLYPESEIEKPSFLAWEKGAKFVSLRKIGPLAYTKIRDKEELDLNYNYYMRSAWGTHTPEMTYDQWLENSQKVGAEEIQNNMLLTRKLLKGETLYVTAKLSNGDTVESAFPIQPIRNLFIEKRPCGTDNDFDLVDEISAE